MGASEVGSQKLRQLLSEPGSVPRRVSGQAPRIHVRRGADARAWRDQALDGADAAGPRQERVLLGAVSLVVSGPTSDASPRSCNLRRRACQPNGRKVRNLLLSKDYAEVFRNVSIAEDFKCFE